MNFKMFFYTGILVFILSIFTFGFEVKDTGFPFKAFVYHAVGIPNSELSNVTVNKETKDVYDITYQGKKYNAKLFPHGSIYLEREGKYPLLITFDVSEFRLNGKFRL